MRKLVIAAIAISVPGLVAANALTDAVKQRQNFMKGYGESVGMLARMAKGEVEYDAATAQGAADRIAEMAHRDTSAWYVPGSSSADLPGVSYALPALWADGAKVGEIAGRMAPAAETLKVAAGEGRAQMAGALGGVGQVCQDCHKSFQAKKD
ncbi:c-type cytochrome [Tropicimonas sp.]|uniref:c-type cytochrome n=1 Tax=Tropicimonas sp. TaxID=2067044 RepID=UPI003A87EEDC